MRHRKPHRIRRKKSILKSRFFWSAIFIPIVSGGIFYFFLLSEFFQIKEIIIIGSERVPAENIKSMVEAELEKKILFFETKSIFLANANKIRERVLQRNPQLQALNMEKRFPNALNLQILERKEVGIFCQPSRCFLLDNHGVVFEESYARDAAIKFQNQTLNRVLTLGEKAFEEQTFTSILGINAKLKDDLKIVSKEVLLVSEERLNVKTMEDWEVYFNLHKDLNWQMAELTTILEKRIPPEKRKELKYIDLRFDKIFISPLLENQSIL